MDRSRLVAIAGTVLAAFTLYRYRCWFLGGHDFMRPTGERADYYVRCIRCGQRSRGIDAR